MKHRFSSHAVLIEMTAVLLVLGIASVSILGLFVTAHGMGQRSRGITRAVQQAQDCAALIQSGGKPQDNLNECGYALLESGKWTKEAGNMRVFAQIREKQTEVGILYEADISVEQDQREVFSMPAAYYDVL